MRIQPQHPFAWMAIFVLIFCGSTVCCSLSAEESAALTNLMPNASFEQGEGSIPTVWKTKVWQSGKNQPTLAWSDVAHSGDHSVMISCDADEEGIGADASWYVELPVKPHSTYRLAAWIKTENIETSRGGRGALLNLHSVSMANTKALTGTNDWTEVSFTFETGQNDIVWINCLYGGWGMATGTAWFDDLTLTELSSADLPAPTITIDATKTAEPMPAYIYGQFIEHLGRCIYGGIWAEMLQDRKFWYPITADYKPYGGVEPTENEQFPVLKASPWQGPVDSLTMVKENAFVGEHTPMVLVRPGYTPNGISQPGLGIVAGKKYVGYAWLKAEGSVRGLASLCWNEPNSAIGMGSGCDLGVIAKEYKKYSFEFTASVSKNDAMLKILGSGTGKLYIGTVSLMPADNIDGFRADTLKLLKELNSPVYRWPGGNFVSGYDWRDGIGDRDRRPPRKNPAWTGVEHNDVGMDEFMTLCRHLGTEPYIAVNTGLGGVESAVDELEYANGSADTPMGKLRAENGHAEPYAVKWWGIGNEMYGDWQLGNIPLEDYIKKHNQFAEAFYAKDPGVKLIAVGDAGRWSEGMMQDCADGMDLISEHFYCQTRPSLTAHVAQIPDSIRRKAEAHRDYRERFDSLKGKDIRIAMDEWNYWYGPHVFGELGTRYFMKDALGIAAGLNEFARSTDIVFMANYAQTVNVIGCIKTDKTDAAWATTGLVLKLYREKFIGTPVETETSWPLDVQAMLAEDGKSLVVSVVNPTLHDMAVPLAIDGVTITGSGTRYEIANSDPMAYNEPGAKPKVVIKESPLVDVKDRLTVAPCSATLFELPLK